jgi:hypothetical protein
MTREMRDKKSSLLKKKSATVLEIVVYLMSSCVNWAFFLTSEPFLNASETSVLKAHECQKGPIYTRTS